MDKDYLNKLFINEVKGSLSAGGGSGGSGAPSDWNAKPGEPGHVLNRTHWKEEARVIIEKTYLHAEDFIEDMYIIDHSLGLKAGVTYTLNIWIQDTQQGYMSGEAVEMNEAGMSAVMVTFGDNGIMLVDLSPEAAEMAGVKAMFAGLSGWASTVSISVEQVETIYPIDEYLSIPLIPTFDLRDYGMSNVQDTVSYRKYNIGDDDGLVSKLESALTKGPVIVTTTVGSRGNHIMSVVLTSSDSDRKYSGVYNDDMNCYNYCMYIDSDNREFVCEIWYSHRLDHRPVCIDFLVQTVDSGILTALTNPKSQYYLKNVMLSQSNLPDAYNKVRNAFLYAQYYPKVVEIREDYRLEFASTFYCRLEMAHGDPTDYHASHLYQGVFVDGDRNVFSITLRRHMSEYGSERDTYYIAAELLSGDTVIDLNQYGPGPNSLISFIFMLFQSGGGSFTTAGATTFWDAVNTDNSVKIAMDLSALNEGLDLKIETDGVTRVRDSASGNVVFVGFSFMCEKDGTFYRLNVIFNSDGTDDGMNIKVNVEPLTFGTGA